ncbi:MAG: serpin family protein [Oscillatoria princeps RMCB-10]|nr:serpin family protein [Oscillatoria princeps RMCB-10]
MSASENSQETASENWQCPGEVKLSSIGDKKVDPKVIAANTRFSFKLFSEILKQNSRNNVFVSPSSVALSLAMTYNGAGGETQQAMAKVLELQGTDLKSLNEANAILQAGLVKGDPKVEISVANSLWTINGGSFKPEFIQKTHDFYSANVTALDSSNPAPTINGWVKQCTRGKISKIIDKNEITPDLALVLINAVYFKGIWTVPFNKRDTADRPFTLLDGRQKQQPMMSRKGWYSYSENEQFQAVSLPYGDGRFSMYVFLPKPTSSLAEFYKNITPENWQSWMNSFSPREGELQLPRFKLEDNIDLGKTLTDLGMGVAFSNGADFSGMTPVPVKIGKIKQKTFVKVNEEGTEAAAVTEQEMRVKAPGNPPSRIFQMIVDRPFFCAIIDNQTGTILFMGSIVEPQ